MTTESALEAPTERYVGRSAGFRPPILGVLHADRTAESSAGLSDGGRVPRQLPAAPEAARETPNCRRFEIFSAGICLESELFQRLSATRAELFNGQRPSLLGQFLPRETDSVSPMPKAATLDDKNVRYRQRLRDAGGREVLFQLPDETVALIDEIKKRQGLRSRSQALLQLIEQGREAARQTA